jgi:hypothetical protein
LVERECWLLRYGGNPEAIAQALNRFCLLSPPKARRRIGATRGPLFLRKGPDPTGRLTRTPLAADLWAAGCSIRLETNSPVILRLMGNSLGRKERTGLAQERFRWRLVGDEATGLQPSCRRSTCTAADGLQFVNLGQRSFLAMDEAARCAVGFLAHEFLEDEDRFQKSVLARLIAFTAAARRSNTDRPLDAEHGYSGLTRFTE